MSTLVDDILHSLNGRVTGLSSVGSLVKNKAAHAIRQERDGNYAMGLNTNGNVNPWYKNDWNAVRAVAALGEEERVGWVEAFMDCTRKKRTTKGCNDYLVGDFESDLWMLIYEVSTRTYHPGTSKCFIVKRPRYREVFAAFFRDRVAQHWLTLRAEPLMEQRYVAMGNVTYNCRKGYGTWKAIEAARLFSRPDLTLGKYDLKGFFMSIDKALLLKLVSAFLEEHYEGDDKETLLWLLEVIVMHEPQKDCIRRSPVEMWSKLPEGKSLFHTDGKHGIPKGNISSQLLANFLMSFFDMLFCCKCVEILGLEAKHLVKYIRFVDDFEIYADCAELLVNLRPRMERWLAENLHVMLHPNKVYLQRADKSVKFVGTVIKAGRVYTSKKMVGDAYKAAWKLDEIALYCYHIPSSKNARKLEKAVSTMNSYLGSMSHTQSYGIRRKIISRMVWLWKCCYVDKHFTVVKIKRQYKETYILYIKDKQDYETSKREIKARARYACKGVRTTKAHHRGEPETKRGWNVELRGDRTARECVEPRRYRKGYRESALSAGRDGERDKQPS